MSPCYDLDPADNKLIFLHALQLMVRHHNTKFCGNILGGFENIIWVTNDILTFTVTLTSNVVVLFFLPHKTLWLMMMYHRTKSGCQRINSSEDIIERVIF